MRFITAKRRQPPAVIIISLIDILIVLLIFLMVTTTFKQQPSLKLTLPESKEAKPGASDNSVIVTIAKDPPHYYLGSRPVTLDKLQQELIAKAAQNSRIILYLRPDTDSTIGQFLKVKDAAKAANISDVRVYAKESAQP